MKLTRNSLKNPAVVAVVTAILMLLGLTSVFTLPLQLLPDIEEPEISIITSWRAAAPNEVESEISQPLEEVLQGIPGLEEITSGSNLGFSWTNLTFAIGTDMNATMLEVISRLNRLPPMPADSEPPVVILGGFQSAAQRSVLSLFAQFHPESPFARIENVQYLRDQVVPRLRAVPGVANIDSFGQLDQDMELQIVFDPYRAADIGVDITALPARIGRITDISGGVVDVGKRQYTLRFQGKYEPADLQNLIVDWREGAPVRLGDFADIRLAQPRQDGIATFNGVDSLYMRVIKTNDANVLATLEESLAVIEQLNEGPLKARGITLAPSFNPAVYILQALRLLTGNLFAGVVLAVGALWWFLRRVRATLLIALTIPVSLLTTMIALAITGHSINVISLAGLAFATGMVLDAAIVVLENIVRLREEGRDKKEASDLGAAQVWGALLASTLTTIAIFLPVLFLENAEGQLFADLALTLAISVSVSLLVAVTILPVAAARWIKTARIDDVHNEKWRRLAQRIMTLTATPRRRAAWIAGLIIAPVAVTALLLPPFNYMPYLGSGIVYSNFFAPAATAPETVRAEVIDPVVARMTPHLEGREEPKLLNYGLFTWNGQNGVVFVRPGEGATSRDVEQLMQNEVVVGFPDVISFSREANLFASLGDDGSVSLHLQGQDTRALAEAAALGQGLIGEKFPGTFVQMDPDVSVVSPVLQVSPRDDRIMEAGLTRGRLQMMVQALGDGVWLGEYFDGERRLDVILKAIPQGSPEMLAAAPVVTPAGGAVPLESLAGIDRRVGPQYIKRVAGRRTLSLTFSPPANMPLADVMTVLEEDVEPAVRAALPPDGGILYAGSADSLKRAIRTLGGNFAIALFLLFMIMAALFRSLKDSFLVIISIPLATVGGILALRLLNFVTFQPLDLLAMIGFIILLGLVVNNAILLVVQTRRSEAEGLPLKAAVEEALRLRLRPIFMSTVTSIFGMLPLLLFPGQGSAVYRGMAAAIVGGMSVSMVFTLILLPSLLQFAGAGALDLAGLFRQLAPARKRPAGQ